MNAPTAERTGKVETVAELSEYLEGIYETLQHLPDTPTDSRERTLEDLAKLAQLCMMVAPELATLAYSILNDIRERA